MLATTDELQIEYDATVKQLMARTTKASQLAELAERARLLAVILRQRGRPQPTTPPYTEVKRQQFEEAW